MRLPLRSQINPLPYRPRPLHAGVAEKLIRGAEHAYPAAVVCILVFRPLAASLTERIVIRLGR